MILILKNVLIQFATEKKTKFGIINGKMYEKRPQRNKIFKSRYLRSTKYPNIWISNNRNSRTHYSINIKFGRDVKKT